MFNTNEITLRLMSNNVYKNTINENMNTQTPTSEDYSFYRKRILKMMKDMLHGNYPNDDIKKMHMDYTNVLIEHLKMQDITDIIQKEHRNNDVQKQIHNKEPYTFDLASADKGICKDTSSRTLTLDNFVTAKTTRTEKRISLPSKREIDIKTEEHKIKGIKHKKVNLVKNDQKIPV